MMRKLFVGGLLAGMTSEQLEDYFSQYGTVLSAQVMKDNVTKKYELLNFSYISFTQSYFALIVDGSAGILRWAAESH